MSWNSVGQAFTQHKDYKTNRQKQQKHETNFPIEIEMSKNEEVVKNGHSM